MIRVAVIGLGKMGLSHLSMVRPHPDVEVVGICDATGYVLDVLGKYTGLKTFTDYDQLLAQTTPDAVVIATPTHLHAPFIRKALDRGIHVFCEKPLVLDPHEGAELAELAAQKGLVTTVGYHNRHVGAFREVKKLIDAGVIGEVNSVLAQAYGPVVLKPAGASWRSKKNTGGGCLYDYAAHPLDLLTWYLGEPLGVDGAQMRSIFSKEIDDAVSADIRYPKAIANLNVHWSDESQRKMSTRMTIWGTKGKIYADRQEVQVYLMDTATPPAGYTLGWNVKYTTELSDAPYFYVRGEEYSHQLDDFFQRVKAVLAGQPDQGADAAMTSTFASGLITDRLIAAIGKAADRAEVVTFDDVQVAPVHEHVPGLKGLLPAKERRAALRRELSGAARELATNVRTEIRRRRSA